MGIWIEIHCDVAGPKCLSHHRGSYPSAMAESSKASVGRVIELLKGEALADGWGNRRSAWVCPNCLKES